MPSFQKLLQNVLTLLKILRQCKYKHVINILKCGIALKLLFLKNIAIKEKKMYSKEELAELILKNPEEYNKYKKNYGEELDLTELDFSNVSLEGIDFSNTELAGTSFIDSHLSNVSFAQADLNAADFTRANIIECDFSESILNGADFNYATASYCNFTDADMAGCIVKEADLSDSDFSASLNLSATRADDTTIWPDNDLLPDDFDTNYAKEGEDEEEESAQDY